MTIQKCLASIQRNLTDSGIETARLDSLVLLEFVTGKNRSWLLANSADELEANTIKQLDQLVAKRSEHEPIAYILGKTEFYGREFIVNHHVLEPRPESETIIELLKKYYSNNQAIIDVGTGSGALAITAKLELAKSNVIASDIDEKCLEVARKNASELGANIKFHIGDLLATISRESLADSLILANLPYVPDGFQINPAAMREPKLAIFGGPDGLGLYRKMFTQIDELAKKPSIIIAESMPPQHEQLAELARNNSYALSEGKDFIQVFSLTK